MFLYLLLGRKTVIEKYENSFYKPPWTPIRATYYRDITQEITRPSLYPCALSSLGKATLKFN